MWILPAIQLYQIMDVLILMLIYTSEQLGCAVVSKCFWAYIHIKKKFWADIPNIYVPIYLLTLCI